MDPLKQKISDSLKQSRYFQKLSESTFQKVLTLTNLKNFEKGSVLLTQGKKNHEVFFLVEGKVAVKTDGQLIHYLNRKGDILGETGVLTEQLSNVTIEVVEALETVSISVPVLKTITQDSSHELYHAFYGWLSHILVDKLNLTLKKAKRYEEVNHELIESLDIQRAISHNLLKTTIELEESKKEIDELSHLKDDFLAIASHDLRSPIGSVSATIETILTCFDVEEGVKELLNSMLELCSEQLALVETFLDVAKLESGTLELEYTSLNVGEINEQFNQIRRHFEMLCRSKQIELKVSIDESLPIVSIDVPKIKQVVNNLMSNAIKFTPEKGQITLHVSSPKSEFLQITVQDTGIGISEVEIEKVFDRFKQIKDRNIGTQGERGTGLGLAICKKPCGASRGTHLDRKFYR